MQRIPHLVQYLPSLQFSSPPSYCPSFLSFAMVPDPLCPPPSDNNSARCAHPSHNSHISCLTSPPYALLTFSVLTCVCIVLIQPDSLVGLQDTGCEPFSKECD